MITDMAEAGRRDPGNGEDVPASHPAAFSSGPYIICGERTTRIRRERRQGRIDEGSS
jgi:hypothetical protein